MTYNWRRNVFKFVSRFNLNEIHHRDIKVQLKLWNPETREGVLTFTHIQGASFNLIVKYSPLEKLLLYFTSLHPEDILDPYYLARKMQKSGDVPDLTLQIPSVKKKLLEAVEEPCPNIRITPREWDILVNGMLYNSHNKNHEPWIKGVVNLSYLHILQEVRAQYTLSKISIFLGYLIIKGLITVKPSLYLSAKGSIRIRLTHNGALVLRRELTGA